MKILTFDAVNLTVDFTENAFRLIPEFRKLSKKKIKGKGDYDGSKKLYNQRQYLYLFFYCDWTSENPFNGISDAERHLKAAINSKLGDDFIPDADLLAACTKYVEIQKEAYPTTAILIAMKRTLYQSKQYFEDIADKNEQLMKKKDELYATFIDNGDVSILEAIKTIEDIIHKNLLTANKFTKDLEVSLEKIDNLEVKAKKEIASVRRVVGGGTVNPREVPGNREWS